MDPMRSYVSKKSVTYQNFDNENPKPIIIVETKNLGHAVSG